ncbi:MAG TPA: CHAT domain-containing protein [Steroidobacteraceae bacterium]|nr:CHAT domain-containing protein [Steroidobacteraceae bacterium]
MEVEPDMLSRLRAAWFLMICLFCGFFSIAVARAAAPEQQSDAYENLAAQLIEAPTAAARAALLQANNNLVSASLESALGDLAEAHRSRGEFAAATLGFSLMRQIAEDNGHPAGIASALRNLGVVSRHQQRYDEARDYLQKGLDIAQRLGDQKLIAITLLNIGGTYLEQGDYAQAFEHFSNSLQTAEAIPDEDLVAQALSSLGGLELDHQGDSSAALEYFQRALAIMQAENPPPAVKIARLVGNIGSLYADRGDSARALEHYRRGLRMLGPDQEPVSRAVMLQNMARIYEWQGDDVRALEYAGRALALGKKVGDKEEVANAYATIAYAEAKRGHYPQSLAAYRKSLTLLEEAGIRRQIAYTLTMMGNVQLRLRRYADAAAVLQRAVDIGETIGTPITAKAYVGLAKVRYEQGNFDGALVLAKQASELARRAELPGTLWTSRMMEGGAYRAVGRLSEAREAFDKAIATVETLRDKTVGGQESQSNFFQSAVAPYQEMVGLLVAQKQFADAIAYAERAKGRALLDVLVGGRVNITRAMTASEQEREQQFQIEITSLNRRTQVETVKSASDEPRRAELRAQLEQTRLAYDDFQADLYVTHPQLKVQRGQVKPVTLEEAGRLLPDSHSALLEYVVAEDKCYLFVLTRRSGSDEVDLEVHTIALRAADLATQAQKFRQQLAERDLSFRPAAAELFKRLLGPARRQLGGKTSVVIVPDGPLWDLPFQALLEKGDRYFAENHAIAYAPSLTVLREMTRLRPQKHEERSDSDPFTLLAMADPDLHTDGAVQGNAEGQTEITRAYRGEKLRPLPEARREMAALQRLYGSRQSEVYTGADARESRFKSEAGKFRILHLATHGILDNASPMYSSVLLSPEDDGTEDGVLEAREIMQMDLKADLVVMSACETARGRISAGEGVIGLTWALFVAGTPTSVVSQWKVESASTAALMLAFHRALKSEARTNGSVFSTARSLQRAELQMFRNRHYAHPFYWAGFVVVGDPN